MKKILYIVLGSICVVIGVIGMFVPILPTTVFLLLAAFFYARSSERALQWLLHNRWFGSYIRNYREGRGMALRDKVITLLLLWLTIGTTVIFIVDILWAQLIMLAVAIGVTIHILWIKTYRPDRKRMPGGNGYEREESFSAIMENKKNIK